MKRLLVLCMLESMVLFGCGKGGHVLQLIPSPNGAYQAVALDCHKGASDRSTLIKVVRVGEPAACETSSLQEVTLTPGLPPRMVWTSDNSLAIDERGAPLRPSMQGEVSFVFTPWQARALSPEPSRLMADVPPVPPIKTPPVESACAFKGLTLPADFSVLVGGAYAGKESTVQIDQSGHAATTMTVSVDNPGKPVVLMLGAYEPTIWSIRRSQDTTILAVLASGYHRQIVTGLDATMPVAIHTLDNSSPCGYFYVDLEHLETLNPAAQRFFGRDIDMVYPARNGEVTLGVSKGTPSKWVSGGDAPVESYIDKTAPLAGEAGLDDAVRKGLLRRANIGDSNEWDAQLARLAPARGLPPVSGGVPTSSRRALRMLSGAYVVLRPMTIPAGLYGGHSVVFYVPKGTERPRGNPGHSTIYDFNDMSCTGTMCHE